MVGQPEGKDIARASCGRLCRHHRRNPNRKPRYTAPVPEISRIPAVTCADRPKWSVVIPVHNCANYLARALPEVVSQLANRDDAEIIVVDDASSDKPQQVVDRLGRGRVQYRPNPGRLCAVGTFNRCLALATGELVHLMHGDDAVLPGFYTAMEQALAEPTVVAAVCRVLDLDANETPLYVTRSYRKGTGVWANALDAFAVSNRVRASGFVVSRAAYERVGGYRTDRPHAGWGPDSRRRAHCVRRRGARRLPAAQHLGQLAADPDRGERPGAGHRDRRGERLCRAEPTGRNHAQGAGALCRVRRPHGAVTG
jgi:hypothetical protein